MGFNYIHGLCVGSYPRCTVILQTGHSHDFSSSLIDLKCIALEQRSPSRDTFLNIGTQIGRTIHLTACFRQPF